MITFHETVDAVDRLNELLKSAAEIRSGVEHALDYLADFNAMLDYSHSKGFRDASEALEYVDKVLIPRLGRIRDALASQTETHLSRLDQARDVAARLQLRLQMLSDEGSGGVLP